MKWPFRTWRRWPDVGCSEVPFTMEIASGFMAIYSGNPWENHRKYYGKWLFMAEIHRKTIGFYGGFMGLNGIYPLEMTNITMENG